MVFGGCNTALAPSPGTRVYQSIHKADARGVLISLPLIKRLETMDLEAGLARSERCA